MKKIVHASLIASLMLLSCSKSANDLTVSQDEDQLQAARNTPPSARNTSPIANWPGPATWDNNSMLQTALWLPPSLGPSLPNYSISQFPLYDYSPYLLNGETEYNPVNYNLMAHFGYISPEAVTGAVVEFTFPHILHLLPHMNNINQQRIYTVNNADNQTVVSCTTNLVKGMNPMFCFLIKVDCGNGNSGYSTFWTDMKVNGVSVKGTIKNKIFDCN
ncbi:MAG TPA: hypothetical protein VJ765_01395 [Chitinophagaceae bacterium]|nr:hypothetical protein [Chitinophagaceae bacterium]